MKQPNATRRVTMQDIARETGYSVNTVSHALRNKDDIARQTRDRIQKVAREMGYMGNAIASSLRSGRTRTLAVILGNMSNPFYGIMTDTIQDVASVRDYRLLIMCSREQAALEQELAEAAVARRVDGILLFPTNESLHTIVRLNALGIPFVLMSRTLGEGVADCVLSDEEQGAYLITKHLVEHGRRRLGYIAHQRIVYSYEKRLEGFNRACGEAGIPESDRHTFVRSENGTNTHWEKNWQQSYVDCLIRWRGEGVDGLFVFCDEEAWHVQSIIQQTPDLQDWDVGIVGFDDIEGTQLFPTGLCSINCDFAELARQGIELLRARIHGDDQPPRSIVCPVRLVCRGSCR